MRISPPLLSLQPDRLVVRAAIEGHEAEPEGIWEIRLAAPRTLLGRIDTSATPFGPLAEALAEVYGETLDADETGTARLPADPTRGHGLFFDLGLDAWAGWLQADADPAVQSMTHLLTITTDDAGHDPGRWARAERVGAVATRRGLPHLDLAAHVSGPLDVNVSVVVAEAARLASLSLLLAPLLATVSVPPSAAIDPRWSSDDISIVASACRLLWFDKVALLATDGDAVDSLLVCATPVEAHNCGTCSLCLTTMTALELLDALSGTDAFPGGRVDPDSVWTLPPLDDTGREEAAALVTLLPAGPLRQAWRSHLLPDAGARRVLGVGTPPLAGDDGLTRVNAALEPTGWQASPAEVPGGHADLQVGWAPGEVPLRPANGSHRALRAAMADHGERAHPWIVADFADPQRVNDPWPARVADSADQAWGPGLCYLAGIAWAESSAPVLEPDAVGRLLALARVRLWWSAGETLDPVRVLESIEHGCLPLQVMAAPGAAAVRRTLPVGLTSLVTGLDDLASIDISPAATVERLEAAAAVVLAGSAERDLALDAALGPVRRRG